MKLREYRPSDVSALARLFYETVHTVNAADYDQKQLDAWADGHVDLDVWNRSFLEHFTVVAEEGGEIVGFGDIDCSGYLDRLYVHKDFQGQGIGNAICQKLEKRFPVKTIVTHASVTARPFFMKRGYQVKKEQQVERKGVLLTNYVMMIPGVWECEARNKPVSKMSNGSSCPEQLQSNEEVLDHGLQE